MTYEEPTETPQRKPHVKPFGVTTDMGKFWAFRGHLYIRLPPVAIHSRVIWIYRHCDNCRCYQDDPSLHPSNESTDINNVWEKTPASRPRRTT